MAKRTTTDAEAGLNTATPNLDPSHELPASTGTTGVNLGAGGLGGSNLGGADLGATGTLNDQGTFQQAKDQAKDLASGAKDQAKNLASEAKDQAKDMANQARDHVQTLVGQQKGQAADRLGSLAEALREAGRKLNEGEQAGDFGQYADRAAQQVERLSGYLRDHELRDFVRDAETFARRRPEVFLGGTLIAGLMLARFLKASSPDQGYDGRDRGGAWTGYPQSARQSFRSSYQGASSSARPVSSPLATPERRTTPESGLDNNIGLAPSFDDGPLGV
jgi:cell division septum initiation protein DivIVA